jgi:hypothetical protein
VTWNSKLVSVHVSCLKSAGARWGTDNLMIEPFKVTFHTVKISPLTSDSTQTLVGSHTLVTSHDCHLWLVDAAVWEWSLMSCLHRGSW